MSKYAEKQEKCSYHIRPAWDSVRADLAFYMEHGTSAEDFEGNREFPDQPEDSADGDEFHSEQAIADKFEDIGDFNDYALSWDYVTPGTFNYQPEGYWRYQISYGGPSTEIRFYASPGHVGPAGYSMYRAEFWFLDWFDGASVNVTSTDEAKWLWDWFSDVGSVEHALKEATA